MSDLYNYLSRMAYRPKTEYKSKDARIHQLQQSMEVMLEYIAYKKESDPEANVKSLWLYWFHCFIQWNIVILDARNEKSFDVLYEKRMTETWFEDEEE